MMPKVCILVLVGSLIGVPLLAGQQWPSESAMLRTRQKQELQALKLKQKYARESLQSSSLPKAVRTQLRHELKQEKQKLQQRQKDERQTLKDRERLLNLELKQLESE
jgi:hypothetical protein